MLRGQHAGKNNGGSDRGRGRTGTLPDVGYEGGQTPFHMIIPKEPYYRGHQ